MRPAVPSPRPGRSGDSRWVAGTRTVRVGAGCHVLHFPHQPATRVRLVVGAHRSGPCLGRRDLSPRGNSTVTIMCSASALPGSPGARGNAPACPSRFARGPSVSMRSSDPGSSCERNRHRPTGWTGLGPSGAHGTSVLHCADGARCDARNPPVRRSRPIAPSAAPGSTSAASVPGAVDR